MEEILDHKWCDCRNRRAVFDFGIYTGSLFFKDQVWFPIYISIEQQGGDSKGKHRADPVSYTHLDVYKRQVRMRTMSMSK